MSLNFRIQLLRNTRYLSCLPCSQTHQRAQTQYCHMVLEGHEGTSARLVTSQALSLPIVKTVLLSHYH